MEGLLYLVIGTGNACSEYALLHAQESIKKYNYKSTALATVWIKPPTKGEYKKSDLENALNLLRMHYNPHNQLAIFIPEAHLLVDTVANACLKLFENLPDFTRVYLLASSIAKILPTIASRSIIIQSNAGSSAEHPLVTFLLDQHSDELAISKIMENEHHTIAHVDIILALLYKELLKRKKFDLIRKIESLYKQSTPLCSSLLFWRAVYSLIKTDK